MQNGKRGRLELLAPAKDPDSAMAAIDCGADAVYIGAPRFGARSLAGNNLPDIERVIRYARPYHARVYVALNTLLKNGELEDAERYIRQFYEMGSDGVIIQDMGILEMDLPPIPLIASTQCHNDSAEKVLFLEKVGFQRAILARELSLEEIRRIRSETAIELEAFVHGALCVCYSGQCLMSYASGGRSGNRGVCAQPCRLAYTLKDSAGTVLAKNKHLLSTRDLNLSGSLEELIDAGVTSLKIEGRLKDIHYVKNIVSFYRKNLDRIIENRGLERSSDGMTQVSFQPDPYKTFNRGYTEYFLHGRKESVASIHTQKSLGEPIGRVKKVFSDYFILDRENPLHNGDGICFFDKSQILGGMFIDRVEGEKIYPNDIGYIFEGYFIYRNQDQAFERELKTAKTERKISVKAKLFESEQGFILNLTDETGVQAEAEIRISKTPADKPEMAEENIRKQVAKLGDTIFRSTGVEIRTSKIWFIPVRDLNELRRKAVLELTEKRVKNHPRAERPFVKNEVPYFTDSLDYLGNVLNDKSAEFYRRHGVKDIEPAAESGIDLAGKTLMTTKHCLKYEFGLCPRKPGDNPVSAVEPLYLTGGNEDYSLEFDCKACRMKIRKVK